MSRKHLSDFNAEFGMNINIENKNNKPTAEITFYADKKDFFKWVLQSEADISALNTEKELSEWLKELSSHYCSTD
jgi:hypothetical protein